MHAFRASAKQILSLLLVSATTLAFRSPHPIERADPRAVADSLPTLARFLIGTWKCRGGTPAGRVMTATVIFKADLGDKFIESEHVDDPPGQYHSRALWPAPNALNLATVVYDNFGGARRFVAPAWRSDSIVWTRDTTEVGARMETFTYRRVSSDAYWYAWHVRRANGAPIVLGDSATCVR